MVHASHWANMYYWGDDDDSVLETGHAPMVLYTILTLPVYTLTSDLLEVIIWQWCEASAQQRKWKYEEQTRDSCDHHPYSTGWMLWISSRDLWENIFSSKYVIEILFMIEKLKRLCLQCRSYRWWLAQSKYNQLEMFKYFPALSVNIIQPSERYPGPAVPLLCQHRLSSVRARVWILNLKCMHRTINWQKIEARVVVCSFHHMIRALCLALKEFVAQIFWEKWFSLIHHR